MLRLTLIAGSVVSNSGFIHQFGTVISADGKKSLDARYVSAWGGTVRTKDNKNTHQVDTVPD